MSEHSRHADNRMWRGLRAVLSVLAVALLLAAPSPASAEEATVSNIRLGVHPDKTRVVLDLSRSLDFLIFSLPDPYRVVIDLPQVAFNLSGNARERASGHLKKLRFGLFEPGTSRVVLDATGPVEVAAAFVLPPSGSYGYRLVIDLKETDRSSFLAASQASIEKRLALRAKQDIPPPPTARPAPVQDHRKVVVLDPGHGGVDPGALGDGKIYEKELVLKTAFALKKELEDKGYRVVLTRDKDVYIKLRDRIAIARRADADLFVSLHADSIGDRSLRGLSVYTLSETASDQEAAALAAAENKSDIIAGMDFSREQPEVTDILIDLAQRRTMNLSARMAGAVVDEMGNRIRLLNRPHRFAGFAVLKAPDVPSVLIELGFLSNKHDRRMLHEAGQRQKLASGLAASIDRYFTGVQSAFR